MSYRRPTAGLTEYETQYINPIAAILQQVRQHTNIRVVAIIEPDSLPNVVTNLNDANCSQAQLQRRLRERASTYALNKLHAIPNVYNYVDIAHSAWLGWPSNMSPAVNRVQRRWPRAPPPAYASIDGFISDTANYTPTQRAATDQPDPADQRPAGRLGQLLPVQPVRSTS